MDTPQYVYCNLIAIDNSPIDYFAKTFFTFDSDGVMDQWWAKLHKLNDMQVKLNLWGVKPHCNELRKIMWTSINGILLMVDLHNTQILEDLEKIYHALSDYLHNDSIDDKQIIIIGYYNTISPLTQTNKLKALEWSADDTRDLVFLEADLSNNEQMNTLWNNLICNFM